jgi:hypothetical protein
VENLSQGELLEWVNIRLIGMLAEADLRGMSPTAVFFEYLDDMYEVAPQQARRLEASLPRATIAEYREWRLMGRSFAYR